MNSFSKGKSFSQNIDRQTVVGLLLAVAGILFSEFSVFVIKSVPLLAVGLSSLILGVVTITIPGNSIPKDYVRAILIESYVNVEGILEQFDAKEKCIFLPPRDKRVFAYIPLGSNPTRTSSLQAWKAMEAPIRVLTEIEGKRRLMVFLPVPFKILSKADPGSKPEEALNYILIEQLEILESVKAIESSNKIAVKMSGFLVETEFPRVKKVLGSLPTCIAGCILSHILRKPVLLLKEELFNRTIMATFEMLNKDG